MTRHTIPIEDNRELLAEYGRAFAWFNLVEAFLGEVIAFQGKLGAANPKLIEKLMRGKTLGAKIDLASVLVSPETKEMLDRLVQLRNELAHGVVSEEVPMNNPTQRTGKYVVSHKSGTSPLTLETLRDAVSLSQDISQALHAELLKGTHFEKAQQ